MRKYVKSNDGYALVIALLVITVVTVLGLGILTTTSSSKKLSEEENKDQTAYYIAEAGLNQKKEELKEIPNLYNEYIKNKDIKNMKEADIIKDFLKEIKNKPILNKETIYREDIFKRKNAEAKVIVTIPSETELKFTITSTGIIKSNDSSNEKKRTVQSVDSYKLAITEKPAEEEFGTSKYVVHALGDLSIINGKVVGNLGFTQPQTTSKTFPFIGNAGDAYYIGGTSKTTYKTCYHWTTPTLCEDKSYKDISVAVKNGDAFFNDSELPKIPEFPKEKFISLDTITQPPNVTNIQQGLPKQSPIPSGNYRVTIAELTQSTVLNIDKNNITLLIADANFNNTKLKFAGSGNLKILTNNFKTSGGDPALIDFDENNTEIYSTNFNVEGGWGNKNGSIKTNGSLKIFNTNQVIFSGDAKLNSTEDITIYSKGSFSQVGSAGISLAKNLNIFSNSVVLSSNMTMTIDNEMNVYAYTTFEADNTIKINSKKNNIFYKGDITPKFNGKFQNSINLDFLNSSLNLNGSTSIAGNIILRGENNTQTKNTVIISGGEVVIDTPLYVYAPKFDLDISGSATILGSVIGKNIKVSGGRTSITYKQPPPDNDGSTGGSAGSGQIDSSLTPNSDSGSIEVNNP